MKTRTKLYPVVCFTLILLLTFGCAPKSQEESSEETAIADITFTSGSEEAMEAFEKGLALFDIGDGVNARIYFTKAIEADPEFAAAHLYRSYSGGSAGEFTDDVKKAGSLTGAVSEGEKLIIEIGQTYLENKADERLELSKKLVEMYPESARAHLILGGEYDARNEEETARKHYMKSIELAPDWDATHTALGFSYLGNEPKDFNAAKEHFGHALEIAPEIAFHHINMGDAHRALDDLEKSAESYTKALELDPDKPVALLKRGHVNSFLGNMDEARMDYQKAREVHPKFAGYYLQWESFTYLMDEGPDQALEWLETNAMTIDDMDVDDKRKNQMKLACTNVCTWIALHHDKPDHIEELIASRNELSMNNAELIGTEDAKTNFTATNVFWEGLLAAMKGDHETAAAKAEENKSLLESNDSPTKLYNYHFLLGWSNLKQENYETAVEHFQNSAPNWIFNKYHLAKAYEGAGNTDKANELYEEIAVFNFNGVGYALIRNEVKEKVSSL